MAEHWMSLGQVTNGWWINDAATPNIISTTGDISVGNISSSGSISASGLSSTGNLLLDIDSDNDESGTYLKVRHNGGTDLFVVNDDGTVEIIGMSVAGIVRNSAAGVLSGGNADIDLTSEVTGILPAATGGTAISSFGAFGRVIYAASASALTTDSAFNYQSSGDFFGVGGTAGSPYRIRAQGGNDSGIGILNTTTGNYPVFLELKNDQNSADNAVGSIIADWDATDVAKINLMAGTDTVNKDDGWLQIQVAEGGVLSTAAQIAQDGELQLPLATSSGQGLQLGSDVGMHRSAADELTISDKIIYGTSEFGTLSSPIASLASLGTTTRNYINFDERAAQDFVDLNPGNKDVDFRFRKNTSGSAMHIEASSGNVVVGNSSSPAGKLHVYGGTSGASPHANADELVIESSSATGISVLTADSQHAYGFILGSASDSVGAEARWNHDDAELLIGTAKTGAKITFASDNHTTGAVLASDGELQLPLAVASGTSFWWGGDVEFYRSAADVGRTPDSFWVDGDISLEGGSGTYKSSDGSSGMTGSVDTSSTPTLTVKDGLIISAA